MSVSRGGGGSGCFSPRSSSETATPVSVYVCVRACVCVSLVPSKTSNILTACTVHTTYIVVVG